MPRAKEIQKQVSNKVIGICQSGYFWDSSKLQRKKNPEQHLKKVKVSLASVKVRIHDLIIRDSAKMPPPSQKKKTTAGFW